MCSYLQCSSVDDLVCPIYGQGESVMVIDYACQLNVFGHAVHLQHWYLKTWTIIFQCVSILTAHEACVRF